MRSARASATGASTSSSRDAEFQRRVDNDEFEEHVSFAGGRYGTLKAEVDRLLAEGSNVILELEVEGAFEIRRRRPDAVLIFIDAPVDELERRLRERNTESAGDIAMRLRHRARARRRREAASITWSRTTTPTRPRTACLLPCWPSSSGTAGRRRLDLQANDPPEDR